MRGGEDERCEVRGERCKERCEVRSATCEVRRARTSTVPCVAPVAQESDTCVRSDKNKEAEVLVQSERINDHIAIP
jgi:hypothetical protein